MKSKMFNSFLGFYFACVLCVCAGGSKVGNDNDFESTMKFLTGVADPKTPLAMPYFLGERRRTDGDSTSKTTTRDADIATGENQNQRLVTTKARHLSQRYDLSASPTVYRETADGREYRDFSNPSYRRINANPKKWTKKNVTPKPYSVFKANNKPKPMWESNVYKPSYKAPNHNYNNYKYNNNNDSKYPRKEKQREREGFEVFERNKNHFKSRFPEQVVPKYNNDKHQRVISKDNNEDGKDDDEDAEDEDEEFVPMRMYAQVRQYESESHLPSSVEEPRLRKIVKDSRIHTVYMEEGYEDGAYDHAGEEKHAEEEEAQVEHRRKRRHIDSSLTNVEIDTDFIGKNQYSLGEVNNNADKKYPYYNMKNINSNSPLRYAQDMDDIPQKKEGNMAFYEDSQARTECDEVVETVEPIPKDLDAGEESPEKTMVPKLPRLKKLGDKIDCLKIKFFGEEPLDNPLFKEELVEPPKDLFNEPEVKETENLLKQTNRTGKSFQPLAVEESGYPVDKLTDEDNDDIKDDADLDGASSNGEEQLPEAEALHMRRITRRRKRPYHHNKLYSGRYAAYRPTRKSHPPHKMPRGTTPPPPKSVLTSQNVISEVYYKDQIKPSEQLNVFADVINHIQNMSRADSYSSASEQRPHVVTPTPSSRPAPINTKLRTGHRKKLKRKYPVMKSTQQLYTDYMHRSKNNPSRIQNDIAPLAQETNVNVGTVQIPYDSYDSVDLLSFKNNADPPVHYSTIDLPLNKYLVPGMKPPLAIEKPMIYSDYQSDNILKRKDWISNHRLVRRKRATRNNYSEIRRQPQSKPQENVEDDDDNDDYVPHRPTNYHYDPDTDRIIYDKKPTTERSVEEIIEEYFEEEPEEPATTKKPPAPHKTVYHKDVLNKENGKTLVDFLAILKSDPSYKPIEDPEPSKEPPVTTTIKPVSTTPPEFLKFLEKLHSSDGYKKIDNPEDNPVKKKPKTTTTEAPVEVEDDEEEEEVQNGKVQNSRGGQFGQEGGLQIFDINDYLPKVKTYTPKTSIDYSKYKTIERTTSRHSLSSRYSEEDEEPFDKSPHTEAPSALKYQTAPPRPRPSTTPTPEPEEEEEEKHTVAAATLKKEDEEEESEPSTTEKSTTTTSGPKIRIRGRTRPTRRPSRPTTTSKPITEASLDEPTTENSVIYTPATHRPPSRVYPRRHRPKIRLRSTTTSAPVEDDNDEDSSETHRRTIRRQNHAVPANHKPDYTPLTISKRMDDYPTMLVQRQARLVTPEIINYNQTAGDIASRPGEINPRRFPTRYKVARLATQASPAGQEKNAPKEQEQINNDTPRGSRNIDRSDADDTSRVKFIKDPNKRLYFYAPL